MTISDYIKKEGERFEGEFWSKFSDKKYMSQQFTSSLKGLAKVIDEQSKGMKGEHKHKSTCKDDGLWCRESQREVAIYNSHATDLSTLIASELEIV